MVMHFAWKEKLPDVQLFDDSWALVNELARRSWTWKDHDQKIDEEDIWRCMWIDLFKWVKDVKMFLSHVNAHQKVI